MFLTPALGDTNSSLEHKAIQLYLINELSGERPCLKKHGRYSLREDKTGWTLASTCVHTRVHVHTHMCTHTCMHTERKWSFAWTIKDGNEKFTSETRSVISVHTQLVLVLQATFSLAEMRILRSLRCFNNLFLNIPYEYLLLYMNLWSLWSNHGVLLWHWSYRHHSSTQSNGPAKQRWILW